MSSILRLVLSDWIYRIVDALLVLAHRLDRDWDRNPELDEQALIDWFRETGAPDLSDPAINEDADGPE